MNFTQVDLCEVIRENLGLYYTEFEEKGIEFKFELPEQKVMIQADKRQISRVFANLYSNALKYNHVGDQVSTIFVIGDRIRVVIKDTGEPIPKQIKQYIFEPFVTGDSSRKSGSGTGLGLSITKKIIELHGGAFELMEDEFEKSFVIYLDHHIE